MPSWHYRLWRLTVGVTGAGAGVESVREQRKLEATLREMLAVGAARRGAAVASVQCTLC
ncbi:MAG TPA: hypothetical protein VFC02_13200 [Anaerolineales bacterium]|nr:hypothetical protein [Anaerolineales bacterium]